MPHQPIGIAFSGAARHGKDWAATQIKGSSLVSIAEPLYWLARYFFGTDKKSAPGMRQFLINVGCWGRGVLSEEFPLTATRALFTQEIRKLWQVESVIGVDWRTYGFNEDIWLDAAHVRAIERMLAKHIPCIVNARFDNELAKFENDERFIRAHVYATPDTVAGRYAALGETPPPDGSLSEAYSLRINNLIEAGQWAKIPSNLLLVWTDDQVPNPYPKRFFSTEDLNALVHDYYDGRISKDTIRL